jgi:hypothetical protein
LTGCDPVLVRTLIALLKSFPASNAFWLARLAGCDVRSCTKALVELERAGAATNKDGRWSLTARAGETRIPDLRPTRTTSRVRTSRGR